jgi:hypothetical protein
MRYAIIEFGKVANIVEADAEFASRNGWVPAESAGIGDTWDGQTFTPAPPPPPVVPQSVTMRQARLALLGADLLDNIDAAIAAIPDEAQRRAAQIEWEYANTVERNSTFVQQMAAGLGMTPEQMDQLFIAAAAI